MSPRFITMKTPGTAGRPAVEGTADLPAAAASRTDSGVSLTGGQMEAGTDVEASDLQSGEGIED